MFLVKVIESIFQQNKQQNCIHWNCKICPIFKCPNDNYIDYEAEMIHNFLKSYLKNPDIDLLLTFAKIVKNVSIKMLQRLI